MQNDGPFSCTMRGCFAEPTWVGTLHMPRASSGPDHEDVYLCDEHKGDYERMAEKRDGYYLSVVPFDAELYRLFWKAMATDCASQFNGRSSMEAQSAWEQYETRYRERAGAEPPKIRPRVVSTVHPRPWWRLWG